MPIFDKERGQGLRYHIRINITEISNNFKHCKVVKCRGICQIFSV